MNGNSGGNGRFENLIHYLEPTEFDCGAPSTGACPPKPQNLMIHLGVTEIDCANAEPVGPIVALGLTFQLLPGTDLSAHHSDLVELLHALFDLDISLGGTGLALDRSRTCVEADVVKVVLRGRDTRWSQDRCVQMAQILGGAASQGEEGPAPPLPNNALAELFSLYDQKNGVATDSPRDRVQSWPARQNWLAGLGVELLRHRS